MWNDSPITTVLACVLKAMVPAQVASRRHNKDQDYLVVSYHDDFSYVWEINGHAHDDIIEWISSCEDRIRTIIVVWDRIPASRDTTINIAAYLTPYDWGLVCSKLVFSKVVRRAGARLAS